MKTWLEEFLYETEELESPYNFWLYSGLATISAVVKDNVYLMLGDNTPMYPNIYVMLLARSGMRKGKPIAWSKKLVRKVNNTRMISGRSSIQAILKEMGTAYTIPGGKVVNKSDAFIVASEFTSSLVEDKASMDILTDLYDRHFNEDEWSSLLKMEKFKLKDPTVTMLVGTNAPHFKNFLQEKDVHGGFIGRMFVISETKKKLSNSLMRQLKHPPDLDKLAPHLIELSRLKGPFKSIFTGDTMTESAKIYDTWYNNLDTIGGLVEDKTGTIDRLGDSVLKMSMLLSLAESTDLEIKSHHMNSAIEMSEKLVGSVRKVTVTEGNKEAHAEQKLLIIEELLRRENHSISREQIMIKYWMHFADVAQLDNVIQVLQQAGLVVSEMMGNKLLYAMPQTKVDELMKRFGENK